MLQRIQACAEALYYEPPRQPMSEPLVQVHGLKKHFPVKKGVFSRVVAQVRAVDGVSFAVNKQETLGLVGESGCGKTTVGRTLLRLLEPTGGKVTFGGESVFDLDKTALRQMRRRMQIIFQDPYASLNPRMTVEQIVGEGMAIHGMANGGERRDRVVAMLKRVGLQPEHLTRYPHEFSGGQRQRIGIARALILNPEFVVCDEAVSALDVSIQAQIINLLEELQAEMKLSYLFIAHDLNVVRHISDHVAVMYLGKIVEYAATEELFNSPLHPYTQALLSAIPVPDPQTKRKRIILPGNVPSPINPPSGCPFHPRCPVAEERCKTEVPEWREVKPGHWVACHLAKA
jgi:oligopeptide/dipeptide ABC transporter ATP-binding protein